MNQAYYWAMNNPGCKIGWISPTYKQAEKVYDEMARAFDNNLIKTNASKLIIETCGSTIQMFSSERYDNIRGFTFDYEIIDEAAWQQEEAWTTVLRATVLVKGKKVIFLSTPRGKNWFFNIFNLSGLESQYKSFKMTSYDNPFIDPKEIDAARLTLPEHIFRQEYLAEFLDNGAGVFSSLTIKEPNPSDNYFAGIDLGRADDYTVLTILNDKAQMVYCERWRHTTWGSIVNDLKRVLERYNASALIEVNSIGDVVFDSLKQVYSDIAPFVTTSKSKQDIIEGLQVSIQNKEITFLDIDWLIKEFNVFTYEYNPKTRSIKYSAPSGHHDDGVMSCAIAYHCLKNFNKHREFNYMFG